MVGVFWPHGPYVGPKMVGVGGSIDLSSQHVILAG